MHTLNEEKVFKDPVHNYIHVQHSTIWRLINTAEFQRLRRIRQLGTSYLTFHGAEHSLGSPTRLACMKLRAASYPNSSEAATRIGRTARNC